MAVVLWGSTAAAIRGSAECWTWTWLVRQGWGFSQLLSFKNAGNILYIQKGIGKVWGGCSWCWSSQLQLLTWNLSLGAQGLLRFQGAHGWGFWDNFLTSLVQVQSEGCHWRQDLRDFQSSCCSSVLNFWEVFGMSISWLLCRLSLVNCYSIQVIWLVYQWFSFPFSLTAKPDWDRLLLGVLAGGWSTSVGQTSGLWPQCVGEWQGSWECWGCWGC